MPPPMSPEMGDSKETLFIQIWGLVQQDGWILALPLGLPTSLPPSVVLEEQALLCWVVTKCSNRGPGVLVLRAFERAELLHILLP